MKNKSTIFISFRVRINSCPGFKTSSFEKIIFQWEKLGFVFWEVTVEVYSKLKLSTVKNACVCCSGCCFSLLHGEWCDVDSEKYSKEKNAPFRLNLKLPIHSKVWGNYTSVLLLAFPGAEVDAVRQSSPTPQFQMSVCRKCSHEKPCAAERQSWQALERNFHLSQYSCDVTAV